ncbi:Uncharacterised protein [Mycoplasmopsis bovirhinis]|uniref:Uncharacterized protein n=1 Tax=Mycoplasmopsis bovirhinis TaxID=29553 RepID=A0A449AF95_9BACT|nr:Uncharacterised protein [Mycoplasmopsis bovirhinis]
MLSSLIFYYLNYYLDLKKQKLPLLHIYNLLNGSTKDFFIKNKIKLPPENFEIIKNLIRKYDKYLEKINDNSIRKTDTSVMFVLTTITSAGVVLINFSYEGQYVAQHLLILIICIMYFIYIVLAYKKYNNKFLIKNIKIYESLQEWKLLNNNLTEFKEWNQIIMPNNVFNKTKVKIFIKNHLNQKFHFTLNLNTNNYDPEIFKTQLSYLEFLYLLPWDKIYKTKESDKAIWN